ncbi:hypothetical protein ABPG74_016176 [Tetrahymena malaccensis]
MSRQSIQNTLSDNIDLQNKSLQGRMFCESIINCLKGDEDFTNISQPYNNTDIEEGRQISQEILKIQNIPLNIDLSTQKSQVDLQQYQKNERNKYTAKTNSNILKQKSSIKNMSKLTETQQKFNNIKNQSIPNSVLSQLNYDKMKVELRSIDIKNDSRILLGQCKNISDLEVSNLQESYINSEITHIKQAQYHSERINEGNYERAVNIIKNILSKSMNRVQRINKHVNNFIQILKDRKNNRTITNLLENEYRLINDQAFSHRKLIRRNFPYRCLQKLCCFDKIRIPIPLFMPTNIFRIYWDILQTIYTYLFIYIYSILIFFAMQDEDTNFIKQYYLYTFIFFLVDTLVTLNTAFFKKDAIITNRKQIAWKYFSSSIFITDAISLITMGSKLMSQNSNLVYNPDNSFKTFAINLLVFFKLKCVNQKKKRFSYAFTLKDNQKHIMKLFNQLLSVVFVAHLVSLAWYTLGQYEIQNGYSVTWISKNNLNEIPYIQLYIYSMYWSVTTMTTGNCNSLQYFLIIFFSFLVGYGDISATNYVEALFITCSMILFSCVFAYSINNIGFILQEIEKSSKELNDSIIIIQRINLYDNQTICQVLKENIRHINSEIEILFKTNESDLYQSSNYDEKFQGELMSTSNQTSQSSLKGESSNKSINEKQLFKSDRSINSTQKDHQASNSLKLIKFVKQPSHQKSQRDSLKDNKIIENLENLLQSERQNSGLNNNTINNKSVHATQNINQFEEDQQIFVSVGNNQHCKENLDKLEKNIEDLKDQINLNSEQIENQNVQGKPHNSKISNNLRLSSSTNRDSSNKSIQESNEDKGKIRQTKLTIKFNPNNQEDCNISNQSCQSEEDAQKQNQGSAVAFKKQKTKSNQQSTKELRSSIDNQVYNGIYSAYVAQSLALISAQSQINKFESTVNKLDEKIQTIYDGKSLSNFERNSFLYNNKRNTSSIFSNLSKRQFGSYEQRASLFQEIDSNTIKKCDKQNSSKRVSYKNKNSVEVFGQNSEAFNEQSQSQKILQRFCKMINGQADEYFRSANQKSNSQTLQNQDFDYFILDLFDIMKNYKKFFPHNNFINILNYNNVSNIKLKKKVNSSKSTKKRRQNIFIQQNSARKSIFCNQIFQQSQFSEIEYEKYKPTFLSYGVQQITESKFPKYQNDISLKIL